MLRRLVIEDFGLIARAEIEFAGALTIFTGETGSGKTMVLGAIAFVLGERAGSDMVRRGASRAIVTLTFEPLGSLRERLIADGFPVDAGEDAIISREMSEAGKSNLRVNGRPATAGYVRDIAHNIADIIGQHEAQRLLAPAYHLELLDRFAGSGVLAAREAVGEKFGVYAKAQSDLEAFKERESKAQAEFEFAQFALSEIRNASIETGEDARLNERRRFLENIEKITSALQAAHEALAGEDGANDALGVASAALSSLRSIDRDLDGLNDTAYNLQEETNALAIAISRALDRSEFDAAELETINARLDVLDRLSKKYGGSIEAVLESQTRYAELVDTFANRNERRAELEERVTASAQALEEAAKKLTALRTKAAARLKKAIERELPELALPAATFSAQLLPLAAIAAEGAEAVEFYFSANAGEPERPLAKVASGGELSRVLLALIVSVVDSGDGVALVFDEIDAGVGGATASAVATRLARLGKMTQVIVVTHLAQIASWAEHHVVLEKRELAGATTITLREAAGRAARSQELARMLSGDHGGVALQHAEELLRAAGSAR